MGTFEDLGLNMEMDRAAVTEELGDQMHDASQSAESMDYSIRSAGQNRIKLINSVLDAINVIPDSVRDFALVLRSMLVAREADVKPLAEFVSYVLSADADSKSPCFVAVAEVFERIGEKELADKWVGLAGPQHKEESDPEVVFTVAPDVEGEKVTPDTPETPEAQENSEAQETTETPETPEVTETPDTPEESGDVETISEGKTGKRKSKRNFIILGLTFISLGVLTLAYTKMANKDTPDSAVESSSQEADTAATTGAKELADYYLSQGRENSEENVTVDTVKEAQKASQESAAAAQSAMGAEKTGESAGLEYDLDPDFDKNSFKLIYPKEIKASSVLESDMGYEYGESNLTDGSVHTSWQEGVADFGKGVTLKCTFEDTSTVYAIGIWAGNMYSKERYNNNNRVKQFKLSVKKGNTTKTVDVDLEDKTKGQFIVFNEPIEADMVTLTIESVYEGAKYDDTVVSELEFYGK